MNWEYHEPSWSDTEYKISIIWTQSRIRNKNSFSAIIYKKLQRLNKLVQCTLKFVCLLSRNSYVLNKYINLCVHKCIEIETKYCSVYYKYACFCKVSMKYTAYEKNDEKGW